MADLQDRYSLIIIGSGPAGLTASIYASRFKIDNLVVGQALGGLAFEAHKICNFPTETEISGMDLVTKMQQHVEDSGAKILIDKVIEIEAISQDEFKLTTQMGKTFLASAILLATGTEHRHLNLANEDKLLGKGISYCATCDAMFYRGKTVAVVGGGNSAHTASLYLAEVAKKVYQIYRGDTLKGEQVWIDQLKNHKNIEILYKTQLTDLKGDSKLEAIVLDKQYQGKKELVVDGLFVEIGTVPQSDLIDQLELKTDDSGYVLVGADQKSSRDRVWVAGDITTNSNSFRQVITACSEGAVASASIFKFLQQSK
ncbi:hypothetical protein DRH14_01470 [Candidatus Shapirobacteria bacterium]|nr:MAG: hypothetical protein DRH14_01470 [Candidatus Shapirobacteria bacterium]